MARAKQEDINNWVEFTFGPEVASDKNERCDRFIEEAIELVQACGYSERSILELVRYVYDRKPGDVGQEVGGVIMTLCSLATAHGVDVDAAGEEELRKVWTRVEEIRKKQATKPHTSSLSKGPGPKWHQQITGLDLASAPSYAVYSIGSKNYRVNEGFYLASCDACGWVGSSEMCGTDYWGDDSEVYCPICKRAGADCGAVAEGVTSGRAGAPVGHASERSGPEPELPSANWRNWFGLRCWLRQCPCRITGSDDVYGWRCVDCCRLRGKFEEDL